MGAHRDELAELVDTLSPEGRAQLLADLRGPAHLRALSDAHVAAGDAFRENPTDPERRAAYERTTTDLREHRTRTRAADRPIVGGDAVRGEES